MSSQLQKYALTFLAVLGTAVSVSAEPWKGKGFSWSHSSGWSLELPAKTDATIQTLPSDEIWVNGKSKNFNVQFRCFKTKQEADKYESQVKSEMLTAGIEFQPKKTLEDKEYSVTASEALEKTKEFSNEMTLGQKSKGSRFVVFIMTRPTKDRQALDPLFKQIFSSVKVK